MLFRSVRWDPKETGNTQGLAASYSTDGGMTWIKISRVNLNPSRGVLRWKIPGPGAKKVRLRISNPSSEVTVSHTSPFEIVPSQAVNNYQWRRVTDKAAYAGRDGAALGGAAPGARRCGRHAH